MPAPQQTRPQLRSTAGSLAVPLLLTPALPPTPPAPPCPLPPARPPPPHPRSGFPPRRSFNSRAFASKHGLSPFGVLTYRAEWDENVPEFAKKLQGLA